MIDDTSRLRLVALARAALEARVCDERLPSALPDDEVPTAGLFVTIYCGGRLRGCLGTIDAREHLGEAIVRLSADVTREDYRFPPLVRRELADVTVSLSILTPAERVTDPSTIEVGRDGLIVEQGPRRGLLLPQVATEQGWDREMLLRQTCIKAGLSPDAWQHGATVLRFQAEVIGEE
ncbi:MAG: AmmeMemoRadiSam system protein A [Vicinamibacterales bacterium]